MCQRGVVDAGVPIAARTARDTRLLSGTGPQNLAAIWQMVMNVIRSTNDTQGVKVRCNAADDSPGVVESSLTRALRGNNSFRQSG
jgi:hypothetical protein